MAIFALGGAISSIGAESTTSSVSQTLQGIYVMLLWVWTGATVLRTRRQVVVALGCWTFSSALNGFAALLQVIGVSLLGTGALEGSRATGLTDHPNDLGAACAIALVPALMLATSRIPGRGGRDVNGMRAVRWCLLALIALGVILSASIGAMFAGLIAILVWLITPDARAPGRLAVVAAIMVSLAGLTLAGGAVTSPTKRGGGSDQQRRGDGLGQRRDPPQDRAASLVNNRVQPDSRKRPLDSSGLSVNVISHGTVVPYQVHGGPISIWYQARNL